MRALSITCLALVAGLLTAMTAQSQDPLAELSRNIAAVISPGPEGRVLVVEEAHGASNIRSLSVGDAYAGWRVEQISAQAIVLRQGSETRIVRILGRPQGRLDLQDAAPVAAFSSAAPGLRLGGLTAARAGIVATADAPQVAEAAPIFMPLQERQALEGLSTARNLSPATETLVFNNGARPVLTPDIEAELRRSLGIR